MHTILFAGIHITKCIISGEKKERPISLIYSIKYIEENILLMEDELNDYVQQQQIWIKRVERNHLWLQWKRIFFDPSIIH